MLNWNIPARRPRLPGGAISEIYKWRCDGRDADPDAPEQAGEGEAVHIAGQRRPRCADEIKDADHQQRGAASEAVGGVAPQERSKHRTVER
jgi:hypothetical protein